MARRRGGDRVVARRTTGERLSSNGTLPRSSYRDFETHSGTLRRGRPVYRVDADLVSPRFAVSISPVKARFGVRASESPYAKQILRSLSWLPSVHIPSRVMFCVRRKQRREVLFALNRAGYSGSARKSKWRRSITSKYGC